MDYRLKLLWIRVGDGTKTIGYLFKASRNGWTGWSWTALDWTRTDLTRYKTAWGAASALKREVLEAAFYEPIIARLEKVLSDHKEQS